MARDGIQDLLYNIGGRLFDYGFNYITTPRPKPASRIEQIDRLIQSLPADEDSITEISPAVGDEPLSPTPLSKVVTREDLDPETLGYQEQKAYDELWLAEGHAKDDFLGCGTDVDCGFKHGMNLVAIAKETKSMTSDPFWDEIERLGKDLQEIAHPDRVKERTHHQEYQEVAIRISGPRRAMQKRIMTRHKGDLSLEEAKQLACEQARREVERRW